MSDLNPLRSPLLALDAQIDLIRWVQASGAAHLTAMDAAARELTGHGGITDPEFIAVETAALAASVAGHTLWIGGDAGALIEQSAASIPALDGHISAGIIPHPHGMAWLSVDGLVLHDEVPVVAVSWSVRPWAMHAPSPLTCPAVVVWPWSDPERRGPAHLRPMQPIAVPLSGDAAAMMDDTWTGPIGRQPWTEDEWAEDGTLQLRWTLAMWVMCGQVLPRAVQSATRHQHKRARRLLGETPPEWGDVHVTTLRVRELDGSHADGDPDYARYGHQWIVRGHWRWQACGPGRKDRRLTWINPHIKGPEGAPLIEVEQVGKLIR